MKYLLAAICAAVLLAAVAFVGSGYLDGRRADRRAAEQHGAVHAMTQQALAAAVAQCDAPPAPQVAGSGGPRRDAAYCEDVAREMDDRPLEIVKDKAPPQPTPAPVPR